MKKTNENEPTVNTSMDDATAASGEKKTAKMAKRNDKKKNPQQKLGDKENKKLIIATVAVILAFVTFFVLTVIQDRIINGAVTAPVVVAIKEVPAGVELNEQNMANYFDIEQRVIDQIPNTVTTYPNARNMFGKVTDRVIRPREIVTEDCFVSMGLYEGVDDPVEISLDLGAIGRSVGGILRAGDFVDIIAVIEVKEEEEGSDDEFPEALPYIQAVESIEETANGEAADGETGEVSGEDIVAESVFNVATAEQSENPIINEEGVTYGITGSYLSQVLAENVRITRVFNSGGEDPEKAAANGTAMVATVVNIAVPKSKVDAILIAQQEGVISLARVEQSNDAVEGATMEETTADGTSVEGQQ